MNLRNVSLAILLSGATVLTAQSRRIASEVSPPPEVLSRIPKVDACSVVGSLTCGKNAAGTTGSCHEGPTSADFWELFGTAGDTITINVMNASSTVDLVLTVQDPETGSILKRRTGRGTLVATVTLPASKRYVISLAYVAEWYTYPYAISLTCGTTPDPQSCYPSGKLQRGQLHLGQLAVTNGCNTDDYYWTGFTFEGTEGVPVRITSDATFPAYIETSSYEHAESPFIGTLMFSDAAGVESFVFYPDRTGVQTLWVSHSAAKVTGAFSLLLEDVPLDPCRRRSVRH